jgi:hypothetical protein
MKRSLFGDEEVAQAVRQWENHPGRPPRNDLYEFRRDLINETPFMSCKRMYQKLRIAKTNCLRVLYEDVWFRKYYLRWVVRSMMENEAYVGSHFPRSVFRSRAMPQRQTSNIY